MVWVVEHVGSGHDEIELALLEHVADQIVHHGEVIMVSLSSGSEKRTTVQFLSVHRKNVSFDETG